METLTLIWMFFLNMFGFAWSFCWSLPANNYSKFYFIYAFQLVLLLVNELHKIVLYIHTTFTEYHDLQNFMFCMLNEETTLD